MISMILKIWLHFYVKFLNQEKIISNVVPPQRENQNCQKKVASMGTHYTYYVVCYTISESLAPLCGTLMKDQRNLGTHMHGGQTDI